MKTIVFIKEKPVWRIYKMAKALKITRNYKLVCICREIDLKLFEDIFDEIYYFSPKFNFNKKLDNYFNYGWNSTLKLGYKRIIKLLEKIQPSLIHCMVGSYDIIKYIIQNSKWPVILDAIDFTGIATGIGNLDNEIRKNEKYCLEQADGICHKGSPFEIDYYRQHGYNINCPEIQWMDYCDEELFADINTKKLSDEDGEIHLVYAGNISTDLKHGFCYYIPLGKELAKQKIHLHLYSNPWQYRTSGEYITMDNEEKYFHFHKPISFKKLSAEIARYDYGLWIHPLKGSEWYERKMKVAIGNKLFSCLEAGLPIIVSDHLEYGKELIDGKGIGFAIKDEDLCNMGKILEKQNLKRIKENVLKVRGDLSLENQACKLDSFYQDLLNYWS